MDCWCIFVNDWIVVLELWGIVFSVEYIDGWMMCIGDFVVDLC